MAGKKRSDGDGSVHQMHTKDCSRPKDARGKSKCKCKWRGSFIKGYKRGKDGKSIPVRATVTAATENGAAARLREKREKHEANNLPIGKVPTVEQWLNHCDSRLLPRRTVKGQPIKENTLVSYRGIFDNYLIPLLGHQRLDRLTADDIEDAWTTLLEIGNPVIGEDARPLSPSTVHKAHVVLKLCLKLAVQRKKISSNPAGSDSMAAPSKAFTEVEPLATADWRKVLDTAPEMPNSARWSVALALGLRQGEALGLRWEDVDLDAGTLRVRQILYRLPGKGLLFGPPKTERSRRTIALPPQLVAELRSHRKEQNEARLVAGDHWQDNGLVFTLDDGRPLDPSVDRRRWKALLEKAGVPHVKLHGARHTAATILLLNGVDSRVVMDIMGWSQISTAANYQHAVEEAKLDAATRMGAAIWG